MIVKRNEDVARDDVAKPFSFSFSIGENWLPRLKRTPGCVDGRVGAGNIHRIAQGRERF